MTDRLTWLRTRVRAGWLLLAAGVAVLAGSIVYGLANPNLSWNVRILGGVGILVGGVGVATIVRYRPGIGSEEAARRLIVEERDERGILIRQRAAQRAYWVSAAIVFAGLMWTSIAANRDLPALDGDALWNFLAAAVIVPMLVYIGSVLIGEHED